MHPGGLRPFTPRELACLQTFPVTHDFAGSVFQKKKQIGNAVPPVLAEALLREVKRAMEKADRERSKKAGDVGVKIVPGTAVAGKGKGEERSKKAGDVGVKKVPGATDAGKGKGEELQTIISIPDDEEGRVTILQSLMGVVVVTVD